MLKVNWQTQLTILWVGQAILMAVLTMSLPYWPLFLLKVSALSPKEINFWSALIYIAPSVSAIFSAPLWGKLGDKYGYKAMIVRAAFGLFLTQTLILFANSVIVIFFIRILQGLLAGFISAAQAWALNMTPFDKRSTTMGKLQSATAVGTLVGPCVGGVLASVAGYLSIFNVSALLCAWVTCLFIFLLKDNRETVKVKQQVNKNETSATNVIGLIMLVIVLIQSARNMITPIFSLYVTNQLGGSDLSVGILYAATGLMIFVSAPIWGRCFDFFMRNHYPIGIIIGGILFCAAGIQIAHAYATTPFQVFLLRMAWGACLGALLPVLLRLLVENSYALGSGTILGYGSSATKVGELLGIILGAVFASMLGFQNNFYIIAIVYCISAFIFLFHYKPSRVTLPTEVAYE